jgi:hypothetical protein
MSFDTRLHLLADMELQRRLGINLIRTNVGREFSGQPKRSRCSWSLVDLHPHLVTFIGDYRAAHVAPDNAPPPSGASTPASGRTAAEFVSNNPISIHAGHSDGPDEGGIHTGILNGHRDADQR